MEKLTGTSKTLDIIFRILQIFVTIGIVCCIVALFIIAVGFIFKLNPDMIGTGYNSLSLGFLELDVAEAYAPDKQIVLIAVAGEMIFTLLMLIVVLLCVKCIRRILSSMKEGSPFHTSVSRELNKLSRFCISLGIAANILVINTQIFMTKAFSLQELLVGDKITHVSFNYELDLTFFLVAAVIFLLSHIFRYGEELQTLSDETL